jgi:hypothetical protein
VAAPLLGANTSEVLERVLHYSPEQIQQASASGAFGRPADSSSKTAAKATP